MPRLTLNRCWKLQRLLYDDAVATQDPKLRAQLALAWDRIAERQRILTMKPLPKSVDVATKRLTKKKAQICPTGEPIDDNATLSQKQPTQVSQNASETKPEPIPPEQFIDKVESTAPESPSNEPG